jgi:alpha-glucosidase
VTLCEGVEGAGSGHDRDGRCEVRMAGGPLRYWVITGVPSRVLRGWAALTGTPARPPVWALGMQYALDGRGGAAEVREAVAAHREHGLPLRAVHVGGGPSEAQGGGPETGPLGFPGLPEVAGEPGGEDVPLVATLGPAVAADPGSRP